MKKVHGIGINDSITPVQKFEYLGYVNGKKKQKLIWVCPHYTKWKQMLERCYCPKKHAKFPNYKDCTVTDEWLLFSNFREWSISQGMCSNKQSLTLDKDILVEGNKCYSPETCIYVPNKINTFILDNFKNRGDLPLGVNLNKSKTRYEAWCRTPYERRSIYLGVYDCPVEAHNVWKNTKYEFAKSLCKDYNLPDNVTEAIVKRYRN